MGLTGQDQRTGQEEEDLECPLPLESHLQELLGGKESFLASAKATNDLELSPLCQLDWIQWYVCQVETLTWWREMVEVPCNADCGEFT